MSKNFVQPGRIITVIAPQTVISGAGVQLNQLFGIATQDASAGEVLQLAMTGVFQLPKNNAAIATGDKVYWDDAKQQVTKTTTNAIAIGLAVADAGSNHTVVNVRLDG